MSNDNYITIRLSFLSYILFVSKHFEAFCRVVAFAITVLVILLFQNVFGSVFFKSLCDFPFSEAVDIKRKSDYRGHRFGHGERNPSVIESDSTNKIYMQHNFCNDLRVCN